jgi:sugar lactone lactonase YvrE
MDRRQNQNESPNLEEIIGEAQVEKIISGYKFNEGPVWIPEGFLLFSDIPANTIYKYERGLNPEIFLKPSRHSNGLTLDQQGRLLICEHERRVIRLEKDGKKTVLAEYFNGKRLNSPNDIVVKGDGSIYFTDPPFGLPNRTKGKELDFSGLYRIENGDEIKLMDDSIALPNGLAFSPDEKFMYCDDSNSGNIYVFDVSDSGLLKNKRLFASVAGVDGRGGDGMKVDIKGNLFCTGPEGISVFDKNGVRLGIIKCPEKPSNLAWGDNDYKSMYITARTSVYRLRVETGGKSLIPGFIPTPVL